ncbi:hypothetical protein MMC11_003686 [Xylographa trunciseda]|nr:hypothetical protein [Xylographa trunciseda]
MTAMHHPLPPHLPSQLISSFSTSRRATAPAAPKLRDSCHACASSKLKCHKEKPTCSRCAKRSIACEYIATKRAGRKHSSRLSINDSSSNPSSPSGATAINVTRPKPLLGGCFGTKSTISGTSPLPSPGVIHPPPRLTPSGHSFNAFADGSPSSAVTDLTTNLDDFFASPVFFSMPDMSDGDVLDQTYFFSTGFDSSGSSSSSNSSKNVFDTIPAFKDVNSEDAVSDDVVSEFLVLSNDRSPPDCRVSPICDVQSPQDPRTPDSPCFCLVEALGLMKQLFPNNSPACTTSSTQGFDNHITIPTIQAVIAQNEQTVNAVSRMLQCSCSQDGYLLAIVSLIVFKVLGWYAAAARKIPSSDDTSSSVQNQWTSDFRHRPHAEQVLHNPATVGSYGLDGEDSARMAAQLVLGKLHCVQRLVNQLSTKLKVQAAKNGGGADTPDSLGYESADSETPVPFSALTLDQLEVDLRRRLKALSLDIREGLRRE